MVLAVRSLKDEGQGKVSINIFSVLFISHLKIYLFIFLTLKLSNYFKEFLKELKIPQRKLNI